MTDGQTNVQTDDGEVIPKCHLSLQQVTQKSKQSITSLKISIPDFHHLRIVDFEQVRTVFTVAGETGLICRQSHFN